MERGLEGLECALDAGCWKLNVGPNTTGSLEGNVATEYCTSLLTHAHDSICINYFLFSSIVNRPFAATCSYRQHRRGVEYPNKDCHGSPSTLGLTAETLAICCVSRL